MDTGNNRLLGSDWLGVAMISQSDIKQAMQKDSEKARLKQIDEEYAEALRIKFREDAK